MNLHCETCHVDITPDEWFSSDDSGVRCESCETERSAEAMAEALRDPPPVPVEVLRLKGML